MGIAELLRHVLLHGRFIPSQPQWQLWELTWQRTSLVKDRAWVISCLEMVVEDANIYLSLVVTDIRGVAARATSEVFSA